MVAKNVTGEHRDKKNASTCVNSYSAAAAVLSILVLRRAGKWEKS